MALFNKLVRAARAGGMQCDPVSVAPFGRYPRRLKSIKCDHGGVEISGVIPARV
jgi:hypothetical protein